MRAVVLSKPCLAKDLTIYDVPMPEVKPGWVLVKIKAFGLNQPEVNLRQYEADAPYIHLPRIPGMECVGEIVDPSNSSFKVGQRVCALLGGMGLNFDGSYAEYCLIPAKNVFTVNTTLTWNEMAAVPLTWFTAWCSLFDCLQLKSDDTILIHGGTSAVGIAAIQIAQNMGCTVLATTKQKEQQSIIASCGAIPFIENNLLSKQLLEKGFKTVDKVLELENSGNEKDYINQINQNCIICHSGSFGNFETISNYDLVENKPNGSPFFSLCANYPSQMIMDEIFNFISNKKIIPVMSGVFSFDEIPVVHQMLERSLVPGKVVISVF